MRARRKRGSGDSNAHRRRNAIWEHHMDEVLSVLLKDRASSEPALPPLQGSEEALRERFPEHFLCFCGISAKGNPWNLVLRRSLTQSLRTPGGIAWYEQVGKELLWCWQPIKET